MGWDPGTEERCNRGDRFAPCLRKKINGSPKIKEREEKERKDQELGLRNIKCRTPDKELGRVFGGCRLDPGQLRAKNRVAHPPKREIHPGKQ